MADALQEVRWPKQALAMASELDETRAELTSQLSGEWPHWGVAGCGWLKR